VVDITCLAQLTRRNGQKISCLGRIEKYEYICKRFSVCSLWNKTHKAVITEEIKMTKYKVVQI